MNNLILLTEEELATIKPGEGITIAAIMGILVAAVVSVIVYRIFMSSSGSAVIPGGFKFTWK